MAQAKTASPSNESHTTVVNWSGFNNDEGLIIVQSGGDNIIFETTTSLYETVDAPHLSYYKRGLYGL